MVKLPRIQPGVAIADKDGKPTRAFVQFWNTTANAIEKQEASQDAILAELAAQLALIIAAQAAADAAQATADAALASGSGSKAGEIVGLPGGTTASVTTEVVAGSYIELLGGLSGGSLDADASWFGNAELTENDGMTTNSLGTVPIEVTSSGLDLGGGVFQANDSDAAIINAWGTLGGNVTYALTITQTSGANFVAGATIGALVKITPPA